MIALIRPINKRKEGNLHNLLLSNYVGGFQFYLVLDKVNIEKYQNYY